MRPKPNDLPTAAELQAIRKWLRDNGMRNQDAQRLVRGDRSNRQNRQALAAHLRMLPKAGD